MNQLNLARKITLAGQFGTEETACPLDRNMASNAIADV